MIERFQDFLSGITVCYKYIQRIKNAEMTEFGLKGTHVACMFYLNHNPQGLTSAQLCTLCAEDKATISRVVNDLRSRGYIQPCEGKNYRMPLHLSEAGIAIAKQMDPVIEAWVAVGGEGLSPQQRTDFYSSLNLIATNLRAKLDQHTEI